MKAKNFNYGYCAGDLIYMVEECQKKQKTVKDYKFWEFMETYLNREFAVPRNSEQWRRIYYTAKRKQKAEDWIILPDVYYETVDISDQLSEINGKLEDIENEVLTFMADSSGRLAELDAKIDKIIKILRTTTINKVTVRV